VLLKLRNGRKFVLTSGTGPVVGRFLDFSPVDIIAVILKSTFHEEGFVAILVAIDPLNRGRRRNQLAFVGWMGGSAVVLKALYRRE